MIDSDGRNVWQFFEVKIQTFNKAIFQNGHKSHKEQSENFWRESGAFLMLQ